MTSTLINHSKSGKHIRRDAQQWRDILNRQRASGLSQTAFCKQENLANATFYKWQSRLSGAMAPVESADDSSTDSTARFLALGTVQTDEAPRTMTVRLDLGAGMVLEIVRS